MGSRRGVAVLLLLTILGGGLFVRFIDLSTHFTHFDDILVAVMIQGGQGADPPELNASVIGPEAGLISWLDRLGWKADYLHLRRWVHHYSRVSLATTLGPMQFLVTRLLVDRNDDYRTTLFWGRLPSAVAGVAGIALFWLVARRFLGAEAFLPAALGSALVAFSQLNVVYAKQMNSYALVIPALLLLLLLLERWGRGEPTWGASLATGLALGLLVGCHYQILFFLPAFFLVLFLEGVREGVSGSGHGWLRRGAKLSVAGLVLLLFFAFYFFMFLYRRTAHGVNVMNAGRDGEFVFHWDPALSGLENGWDLAFFLSRNGFLTFQNTLTPVPEATALYLLLPLILASLALWGWRVLWRRGGCEEGRNARLLSRFMLVVALTWIGLVASGGLALSPTRHTLVLLPLAALAIGVGLMDLVERGRRFWDGGAIRADSSRWQSLAGLASALFVAGSFLFYFPQVMASRQDPFDESALAELLERHRVETVITYGCTDNPILMPSISSTYPISFGCPRNKYFTADLAEIGVERLAMISHRSPMGAKTFFGLMEQLNSAAEGVIRFDPGWVRYRILESIERPSDQEIGVSSRIRNGTNGLFIYVVERISAAPQRQDDSGERNDAGGAPPPAATPGATNPGHQSSSISINCARTV